MTTAYKVPSSEEPGHTAIFRHPSFKDGTHNNEYADITTLYEVFQSHVQRHPQAEFLGTRTFYPENGRFGAYTWMTTSETQALVDDFGSGLDHVYEKHVPRIQGDAAPEDGVPEAFGRQQGLGIFATNRAEWLVSELAAFRTGRYSVGVIDVAGVGRAEFDMNHSGVAVVVCSMDKIPRMLDRAQNTPGLKVIVSMDKLDCSKPSIATQAFSSSTTDVLRARAESLGIALLDMDEVVALGRLNPTEPAPPKPTDLCTLCYSSGTAGAQKGVLATHASFTYAARSAILAMRFDTRTTYLSYIPLYHVFDRYAVYAIMHSHIRIGFHSGDAARLLDDMQALQPTVLTTIPHVLNRMYERLAARTVAAASLVGAVARVAYGAKLRRLRERGRATHALWDALVFSRVRALFGGRVHTVICGSAPLDGRVQDFFRAALSCHVIQGYGQTETMAGGLIQRPDDRATGTVGVPNPGVDVRLRSIPEMGYMADAAERPRGELLVRGACVFAGYLRDAERTRAALLPGGWLATGDVAEVRADGTLALVDRIKHVIKTARALWIEPEPLETQYAAHPLCAAVFLHGSPHQRELVALVVPSPAFDAWAARVAGAAASRAELCARPAVQKAFLRELHVHAARLGLPRAAHVAAVHLEPRELAAVDSKFYTITLKLRRHAVREHYATAFDVLYKSIADASSDDAKVLDKVNTSDAALSTASTSDTAVSVK
ncbi:medium-chain fatty acid-CoA ligase faa2 [Coemansia sp. RSA 2703]|nr:medium-chain fatty acid-CoA ligase faa2 [Coemansia sp. RSA 2703]KAJ2379352.1 medium-chain fatty acid-CoA ligase faa2 [Coemansia sp. RSA 2607]KAJ2398340.1 medium-chain fatty acid-CoA ligase faa2 [Coemansia sp. RSA 2603]